MKNLIFSLLFLFLGFSASAASPTLKNADVIIVEVDDGESLITFSFTEYSKFQSFINNQLKEFRGDCEITITAEFCMQPGGVGGCVSVSVTGSCSEVDSLIAQAGAALQKMKDHIL